MRVGPAADGDGDVLDRIHRLAGWTGADHHDIEFSLHVVRSIVCGCPVRPSGGRVSIGVARSRKGFSAGRESSAAFGASERPSLWTAITAIPSVPFGLDRFHGSFEFGAVLVGLIGHMINAMMLGALGVALLAIVLGRRPSIAKAVALGMMFGLLLEVVVVNLIVNRIQAVDTLYTSTPQWSWWVAHAMYGAALGLVAARLLRRRDA